MQDIKRFVSSLILLAFDGFKAYMVHKTDQKLQKGIQILIEKKKRLDFRIESVENDMMSITKASLYEINHMKTTINKKAGEGAYGTAERMLLYYYSLML